MFAYVYVLSKQVAEEQNQVAEKKKVAEKNYKTWCESKQKVAESKNKWLGANKNG